MQMRTNFKHTGRCAWELLSRTEEDGKRFYKLFANPDLWVPSVTTVLGATSDKSKLEAWRERVGDIEADKISSQARRRGLKLHAVLDGYLRNEGVDFFPLMPDLRGMVKAAVQVLDRVEDIEVQEGVLFSGRLQVAGRVDLVAHFDGVRSVVDFKNARDIKDESWIEGYFLQTTLYALMYEEMYGERIDQIVVMIMNTHGTCQTFVKDKTPYISTVEDRIREYHQRNPL